MPTGHVVNMPMGHPVELTIRKGTRANRSEPEQGHAAIASVVRNRRGQGSTDSRWNNGGWFQ